MTEASVGHRNLSLGFAALAGLWLATASLPCAAQQAASPDAACAELAKLSVPAASIQLPTGGAKVTSAAQMAASTQPPRTVGSFCRVMAEIASVNTSAPADQDGIEPAGRLERQGVDVRRRRLQRQHPQHCGHHPPSAGGCHHPARPRIRDIREQFRARRLVDRMAPLPLNDEALGNYALDAVKKTRDAAVYLMQRPLRTCS